MCNMEQLERRKRGRPRRKFMDVVEDDVQRVCVTEEDARVKYESLW